jgi:hypothetical protein
VAVTSTVRGFFSIGGVANRGELHVTAGDTLVFDFLGTIALQVSAIAFIFGFRFFGFGVLDLGVPTTSTDLFFFSFSLAEKEEVD